MADLMWEPLYAGHARLSEDYEALGIRQWYRSVAHERHAYSRTHPTRMRIGRNVMAEATMLWDVRGFNRLAQFLQLGDRPLMQLALPDANSVRDIRLIRDAVLQEGGTVIWVPGGALERSEVNVATLEVLDMVRSEHPTRADEQLLRGLVHRPTFGSASWSPWGGRAHADGYRTDRVYFLSGYDQNEARDAYFLCELPPGERPKTVAEAYETLKPPSVKIAEAEGRMVKRQGDMFFIRMPWWEPTPAAVTVPTFGQRLFQSNHVAEDAIWEGKLTFVKGRILHVPGGRPPDHEPLDLGREFWWLCVRNTVPVVR